MIVCDLSKQQKLHPRKAGMTQQIFVHTALAPQLALWGQSISGKSYLSMYYNEKWMRKHSIMIFNNHDHDDCRTNFNSLVHLFSHAVREKVWPYKVSNQRSVRHTFLNYKFSSIIIHFAWIYLPYVELQENYTKYLVGLSFWSFTQGWHSIFYRVERYLISIIDSDLNRQCDRQGQNSAKNNVMSTTELRTLHYCEED